MSFRDLTESQCRSPSTSRSRTLPSVTVRGVPSDEDSSRSQGQKPMQQFIRRPIVLHGRVQRNGQTGTDGDDDDRSSRMSMSSASVRKSMERRSMYSQLLHETNHYLKTVSELEALLPQAGESPEAAWRAKILMRSAHAVDADLWKKLYDYEKSLHNREEDPEVRQAQTACMKLHRDFKRSHKALVMAMTQHEKTQRAEMAKLGAVGWSEKQDEEDFYTRAMREREEEIQKMNISMYKVKNMYEDLGLLIQKQQEPIDHLEDTTEEAHVNTKSGWEELFCYADRDQMCRPEKDISMRDGKWKVDGEELVFAIPSCHSFSLDAIQESLPESLLPPKRKKGGSVSSIVTDENSENSPRGVVPDSVSGLSEEMRSNEDPSTTFDDVRGVENEAKEDFNWMMPFETFASDMKAFQQDIVQLGDYMTNEVMKTNPMATKSDT